MILSIIIPCYNSAQFIAKTLDMLLANGLQDSEIIVVNDGSTDATATIVRKYAEKNKEIYLIDKKNEGVSIARNTGLQAAKGKYVYFLDSDDTLIDGTLDFFRKTLIEQPHIKFFAFGYYSQYKKRKLKDYAVPKYTGKTLDELQLKKIFFSKKLCFHICSCIYECSFLRDNNLKFTPGLRIGEDVEFLLKVLQVVPNCFYNSRHCYVYQIRDDSTMQGYKTFSKEQYHSYEVRRNMCFTSEFQEKKLVKYTNFWLLNQLVSHLYAYLKSDFCNKEITKKFINDLQFFKLLISYKTAFKNLIVIFIAKMIPWKLILKTKK